MRYIKTLLHFDDSNNVLKDECSNITWKTSGTNNVNIGNAKFGKALQFTGNNYIYTDDIVIGGQDFTIDFWGYMSTSAKHYARFVDFNNKNWNRRSECLWFGRQGSTNSLFYETSRNETQNLYVISNTNTIFNSLHHYAIVYTQSNKTHKVYIDGKEVFNLSWDFPRISRRLLIGYSNMPSSGDGCLVGTMDEFRISDGIARYTSNFTPPTQQFIYGPYAEFPNPISGTYDKSPNGLKYNYRVRFEQGPWTETSNVVNYETCQKLRLLMYLYKILIISIFLKTLKIRVVS